MDADVLHWFRRVTLGAETRHSLIAFILQTGGNRQKDDDHSLR